MRNEDHIKDFDAIIDAFIEIGSHLQGEKISPEFAYLYNAEVHYQQFRREFLGRIGADRPHPF
jgi:hypothetical protein